MTSWIRTPRRFAAIAFIAAVCGALAPGAAAPAPATKAVSPERFVLSDPATETYRWAFIRHRTIARARPSYSGRALSRISFRTPELYRNVVQVLDGVRYRNGKMWIRVRLAILPNGSTGWVPRGALAEFQKVRTRMVIQHSTLRATLYKRGRPIFRAITHSDSPTRRRRVVGSMSARSCPAISAPMYGPAGLRAERALCDADRLARRRLHRHPRHERAEHPSRPRLARLRADAERRDPAALPAGAARHAGRHSLAASRQLLN